VIAYNEAVWRRVHSAERRGNLRLLLVLLAVDAVALSVRFLTEDNAVVFSRDVAALLASAGSFQFRALRVEGRLVPVSRYRLKDGCEFRFRIAGTRDASATLDVRYPIDLGYPWSRRECALPDTFCDAPGFELTAIVEGKLEYDAGGFHIAGTHVWARCPGKYEMRSEKYPPRCLPIPMRG
jgi:hypothetical protein